MMEKTGRKENALNRRELSMLPRSLCVYDLADDPVMRALQELLDAEEERAVISAWSRFFQALCAGKASHNLAGYLGGQVLLSDNLFTRAAACGTADALPRNIKDAVLQDLRKLERLAKLESEALILCCFPEYKEVLSSMGQWKTGEAPAPLRGDWASCYNGLCAHYKTNGYGVFAKYHAFVWRSEGNEGRIVPVTSSNPIKLSELKGYERQRQEVIDNTESFLLGLPANNTLLYGDRGTGKSSTVHAMLNTYAGRGLRLIEMPKSGISQFPLLLEQLMDSPMKFIVFIDDLSFDSDDDSFAQLKAALEGSVSARQKNTIIYATSNRRHLVRERFSSREGDEVHRGDTMQEQLSLSDRFGLSITFVNPDRQKFYDILDAMVEDRGLCVDVDYLHRKAEQWSLERGGRSPRVAKQFIDLVESRVRRQMEW